jgi:hypothetical protein
MFRETRVIFKNAIHLQVQALTLGFFDAGWMNTVWKVTTRIMEASVYRLERIATSISVALKPTFILRLLSVTQIMTILDHTIVSVETLMWTETWGPSHVICMKISAKGKICAGQTT